MKLLIVDDEPIIRRGIKSLIDLKELGIDEVLEATNGEKALEIFKEALPDIVLADINMPRMNGLDFAQNIKGIKPEVKIAMITGYDYFDYALKALKVGVDDYILKPVSREDIKVLLIKLIMRIKDHQSKEEVASIVNQFKVDHNLEDDTGYKALIIKVLDEHMNEAYFSLNYLADSMGLSMGYLSGLFKKLFGVSFKEYVLSHRLDQAKLMLLSTKMKNYEIGEMIGIEDPNYFSAVFKKRFGCSPNQYREKAGD